MPKQPLIRQLTLIRDQLYDTLRPIPEAQLMQRSAIGAWSIADVCGHLSAWENRLLTDIQRITQEDAGRVMLPAGISLHGDLPADPVFDDTQWRKRRQWSWREILNELVLTREETGWTLANMSEQTFDERHPVPVAGHEPIWLSPADLVQQLSEHDRHHTADIWRWWQAYQR